MNMKKILAAIAACAMSAAMLGMTVCAAGVTGDDEPLLEDGDDTSIGDITLDDGDDDEGPAIDDGDDGDDANVGGGDVVSVPSPGTGNAPIALAVIPVALAAAAVVAKKAK